jgi:Ankyrin repeats (many copies)
MGEHTHTALVQAFEPPLLVGGSVPTATALAAQQRRFGCRDGAERACMAGWPTVAGMCDPAAAARHHAAAPPPRPPQLRSHGASLDCRDRQGCTPMVIAAQYGFVEQVIYLLKAGARPDILDENEDSALHWAVSIRLSHVNMSTTTVVL